MTQRVLEEGSEVWNAKGRTRATRGRTVETPLIRDVIHEQYPHGASIVCSRDGPKALLAGGIPYLQLDPLPVQLDGPDLEVYADGRDE